MDGFDKASQRAFYTMQSTLTSIDGKLDMLIRLQVDGAHRPCQLPRRIDRTQGRTWKILQLEPHACSTHV
jgi:hypothetical protein